jgi:hypothetical protein
MTRRLLLFVSLVAFHVTAGVSSAQELEIFQIDDFISPAEVGTDTGRTWFFASRALAGTVSDYTRRNDLLDQGVNFVRVVNNFYAAGWQVNFNLTRFGLRPKGLRERYDTSRAGAVVGNNMEGAPVARVGVEVSRYLGAAEGESVRWRVKWSRDTLASNVDDHEFASDIELKFFGPNSVLGGLQYVWKPSHREHIIEYGGRVTVWRSERGDSVFMGLGAGGEITDGEWRSGVARIQGGLMMPLPLRSTYVHVVGSLAGLPGREHLRFYQMESHSWEGSVFIDVPLFAHLSSRR